MQKYFTRKGDNFIISSKLREYMDFSLFDLLTEQGESPPASIYGNFDLIFCSNVLFYYKPELRLRILDKLSKNLSPGGFLVTGETERELVKNYKFREVVAHSAIFQKNN
jgi:chemotaxis methyl-accepting protein methylase